MKRAARAAYWLIPPLVCIAVYWSGLKVWFQQDDFAWLGLKQQIHGFNDLLRVLFAPMAQGTIRTLSERTFFLVFPALFGIDPLPFRIWVLLTQVANVVLLSEVVRRVSGSKLAGFAAPLFWILNAALVTPMSWTSAYNQVLCSFFLLLGFFFWVRYTETDRRQFLAAQWIAFLLGFGALEVNVVYPALAAGYAFARARKYWKQTIPMFAVSVAYVLLHWWVSPKAASGVYSLHFDLGIWHTLSTYWHWGFGATRFSGGLGIPRIVGTLAMRVLPVVALCWVAWSAVRRRWLPLFFLGWFVIVLSPVLVLPEHMTDYYLASPTVGLAAMLALWFADWCRPPRLLTVAAVALAVCYAAVNWPQIRLQERFYVDRGRRVEKLVLGVAQAGRLHPGKIILLTGVTGELFWTGVLDDPFRLYGIEEVYLVPGAEAQVDQHPELGTVSDFVLPQAPALLALKRDAAVVYDASGERLRNITFPFTNKALLEWKPATPRRIEAGKSHYDGQLGTDWTRIDGVLRWTSRQATATLGGPETAGQNLFLSFFCPKTLTSGGPAQMRVTADGQEIGDAKLDKVDDWQEFAFPLPQICTGREKIVIRIELDRVWHKPGDSRDYGVAFGRIEIR